MTAVVSKDACFWCLSETQECPTCRGVEEEMEACGQCAATGRVCTEHDDRWVGTVECDPVHALIIDEWLRLGVLEPDAPPTCLEDLPSHDSQDLHYIAFTSDYNLSLPIGHAEDGHAINRWLKATRDLAIQQGGATVRILRGGPVG